VAVVRVAVDVVHVHGGVREGEALDAVHVHGRALRCRARTRRRDSGARAAPRNGVGVGLDSGRFGGCAGGHDDDDADAVRWPRGGGGALRFAALSPHLTPLAWLGHLGTTRHPPGMEMGSGSEITV
jgi:hypothetical protein